MSCHQYQLDQTHRVSLSLSATSLLRMYISFILAIICLLTSACSPHSTSKQTPNDQSIQPLILWHALRGTDHQNLKADLAQFEANTGLLVTALQLPHNAFANKLQVSIPRGNGPDLFIGPHDRIGDWAEAGHLEPLSFWIKAYNYQQFMRTPIEAFTYRQQLYGLPLSCKALALFYNPQLINTPPQTIDELKVQMKALSALSSTISQKKRTKIWGLAYPEMDSLYFHAPWLHAFGGRALREGVVEVNSNAMRQSIELIKGLRDQKLIPPEVDGALSSDLFRRGQLAFLINGPWFMAELSDFDPTRWAVAKLPKLTHDGEMLRPYLSVEGVMVSSRARQTKNAWRLATYLASPEVAKHRLLRGELIAYHKEVIPSSKSLATNPWHMVFQTQIQESIPLSNHPKMKSLWTPVKRALGQSILYQAPIQKALDEAQKAIERIVNSVENHD
jgi:maltose-binding protein MalE